MNDTPNYEPLGALTHDDLRIACCLISFTGQGDLDAITSTIADVGNLATARRVIASMLVITERMDPALFTPAGAAFASQLATGFAADSEATE